MKRILLIALLFCLSIKLFSVRTLASDKLESFKNGVVKITSYQGSEQLNEGAGLVVGKKFNRVFILTAHHLIKEADRVEIKFRTWAWEPFEGQTIERYHDTLDIGVIIVNLQSKNELNNSFPELAANYQPEEFVSVTSIGHPAGKEWRSTVKQNQIQSLSYEDEFEKLAISKISIGRGYSGGPLFDEELNLIGMITAIDPTEAVAVKIEPALHLLDSWGIPTNLVAATSQITPEESSGRPKPEPIIKPTISRFELSPQQISNGASTTLMWKVNNANSVEIAPGIGKVALEGRRMLQPSSTTTYTLTAQNAEGITTATYTIDVLPIKRLYIQAVTSSPSVAPGQKMTIYVTVVDENGLVVPGAKVLVAAGGGKFLESATIAYDPQSRLHGPYSVSGLTASNGVYTAWWVCNPAASGYSMSVKASKEGYTGASGELTVNIH